MSSTYQGFTLTSLIYFLIEQKLWFCLINTLRLTIDNNDKFDRKSFFFTCSGGCQKLSFTSTYSSRLEPVLTSGFRDTK